MLLGRVVLSGIGLLFSCMFIAASATMNYAYLSRQAETPWEGQIFGGVAVAVTVYNAAGFFFIRWGWENGKRKLFVPTCAALQTVFLTFSLMCALGFAATNRGAVTGSREVQSARLASAEADWQDTSAKLQALAGKKLRAPGVIEENLGELRQDRRWQSSRHCEDATAPASLDYCRGYFQQRQELKSAVEFQRLEGLRQRYKAEILKLRAAGADRESDPQASYLVRLLRGIVDIKDVQLWLVAFVALVVEMGAALGPYLATGHGFAGGRAQSDRGAAPARFEVWPPSRSRPPALPQLEEGPDGTWQVVQEARVRRVGP